ncbi:MAG: AraC family transcriptional regulator [Comamonadaceae bacterium]|nr:AraC family transcriptional regulator [Comamonadaceae bacterium]
MPDSTFIVPPTRVVWVPPDVEHCRLGRRGRRAARRCTWLQDAPRSARARWPARRRATGRAAACSKPARCCANWSSATGARPDAAAPPAREQLPGRAAAATSWRARARCRWAWRLPADKRLRALVRARCWTIRRAARAWTAGRARPAPASRTVARLFRQELGTTFAEWRQQVLLAKALAMAARKRPMSHIAAELGYASPSAFRRWCGARSACRRAASRRRT